MGLLFTVSSLGCSTGRPHARQLYRSAKRLSGEVDGDDPTKVEPYLLLGSRGRVDMDALMTQDWADALGRPTSVRPEALVHLASDDVVQVIWTDSGWRFAADPSDAYRQATPRDALRSFVRASRNKRWDRLLDLAPRRYRIGLSEGDLEKAWTDGDGAAELAAARDRLAEHLADPIRQDTHQAIMDLGEGHFARLEREGDRWVVVDF